MSLIMKFVPAVAVSLLVAACGGSSSSTGSPSAATSAPSGGAATAVVKLASVSSLGAPVLVDAQGLTLYRLAGEQNGKWICTAACVKAWHPLAAPTGGAPSGSVGSLASVKRPNGAMQVTFKGLPLYTFVGDTKPGEAKGQGLKDVGVWTAVTANGSAAAKPVTATKPTTATTTSSSSGGGYGY